MDEARTELIERPGCPRCGYDLRGAVESWSESCPLAGTCSECGLAFEWANALRADRQRLPWLYEHARRWWSFGSVVRTLWMLLLPWRFWGRVRLHHGVVWRRLAVWIAFGLVGTTALGTVGALCVLALPMLAPATFGPDGWGSGTAEDMSLAARSHFAWALPFKPDLDWYMGPGWAPLRWVVAPLVGSTVAGAAMVLACPSEWRRSKVRAAHLARVAAYALSPAVVVLACAIPVESVRATDWVGLGSSNPSGWSSIRALVLSDTWFDRLGIAFQIVLPVVAIAGLSWQAVYWWFALGRGLELKRAWPLWLLCIVGGALGAAALPASMHDWLSWN